jgi:AcrR family transcriptional regulator
VQARIKSGDLVLCHTGTVGKRQEARERIEAQIIELGRRQLVTEGAANLSLRAIARDLGMVSSAVYRYVASRDELLTLLLVDGYSDLADTVDRAREASRGWRDEVLAIAQAMRRWAVSNPASWSLLYGSPVPGYRAPAERTTGPGTRVIGALLTTIADGVASGDVRTSDFHAALASSPEFDEVRREFGFPGDDAVLAKCFLAWAGIVGAISLEVFGQYGPDLAAPEVLFDTQVRLLIGVLSG